VAEPLRQITVTLTVNGRCCKVTTHPLRRLLDVLRDDLGLTGAMEGCGEGECGACTVLCDGVPILGCLTPICQVEGRAITTIEGLAEGETLHAVQQALLDEGGVQCGACTPGLALVATHWLAHPDAAADLREALAGNQCRCTGYGRVHAAVEKACACAKRRETAE